MQVKQVTSTVGNSAFSPAIVVVSSVATTATACAVAVMAFLEMSSALKTAAMGMAFMLIVFTVLFSVAELIKLGRPVVR